MELLFALLLTLALAGALFLVPFGLPGVWIMILILGGMTVAGEVAWLTLAGLAGLALLAELVEWGVVAAMGRRYGGSGRAFWGAILGGFVGALLGMPVPVAGPILAGVIGTFLGAAALTLHETRSVRTAGRVGWGTALARVIAVGVKVGVGIVVLAVGAAALLVG